MLGFKEYSELDEANIRKVNRVRGGKVQRRKIVSNRPGYRVSSGKLVRMSALERMKRHRAQLKAARKRKTIMSRILRKRQISLRKRKGVGLK